MEESDQITLSLDELDQLLDLLRRFQQRFLANADVESITLPSLIDLVEDISENPGVPN